MEIETPREQRAWFTLGALIGVGSVWASLPASPLAAVLGAAQGVLICSRAFGPRIRRAGLIVAGLIGIVALLLHFLGVSAFQGSAR